MSPEYSSFLCHGSPFFFRFKSIKQYHISVCVLFMCVLVYFGNPIFGLFSCFSSVVPQAAFESRGYTSQAILAIFLLLYFHMIYVPLTTVLKILWFHLLSQYHRAISHSSSSFCWIEMVIKIIRSPENDMFQHLSEILSLKPVQCCWKWWIDLTGYSKCWIRNLQSRWRKGKNSTKDFQSQCLGHPSSFLAFFLLFITPNLIFLFHLSTPSSPSYLHSWLFICPDLYLFSLHFCCSVVFCKNPVSLS